MLYYISLPINSYYPINSLNKVNKFLILHNNFGERVNAIFESVTISGLISRRQYYSPFLFATNLS